MTGTRAAFTLEQCWHDVPGGTGVAAIETARALRDRGDIDLIGVAARHGRPPPAGWDVPIDVAHLPLPRAALYEAWNSLRWPPVQRATGTVDVVHATSLAVPPATAPLVVTVHDLLFLREPEHFTRWGVRFFNKGLRAARSDAEVIMCSSRATMDDCAAAGFDKPRLRLVPMGVRIEEAGDQDIRRARDRYGLQRPYVLWVGTVEPRKNLRGLLAAFSSIDADVDLVLVGPKGWKEDLEPLIAGPDERVRALGFVPQRDLAAVYAGAAAFCMPSFYEGFGLPVLEAMAQGTPVVTSKGTSTEEVAGDAAFLVDPRDTASIARGIATVLTDEALARRLRSAGPSRAREFSWERTAALVAEIYAEVS